MYEFLKYYVKDINIHIFKNNIICICARAYLYIIRLVLPKLKIRHTPYIKTLISLRNQKNLYKHILILVILQKCKSTVM